jgi:hypothetical protein
MIFVLQITMLIYNTIFAFLPRWSMRRHSWPCLLLSTSCRVSLEGTRYSLSMKATMMSHVTSYPLLQVDKNRRPGFIRNTVLMNITIEIKCQKCDFASSQQQHPVSAGQRWPTQSDDDGQRIEVYNKPLLQTLSPTLTLNYARDRWCRWQ